VYPDQLSTHKVFVFSACIFHNYKWYRKSVPNDYITFSFGTISYKILESDAQSRKWIFAFQISVISSNVSR